MIHWVPISLWFYIETLSSGIQNFFINTIDVLCLACYFMFHSILSFISFCKIPIHSSHTLKFLTNLICNYEIVYRILNNFTDFEQIRNCFEKWSFKVYVKSFLRGNIFLELWVFLNYIQLLCYFGKNIFSLFYCNEK